MNTITTEHIEQIPELHKQGYGDAKIGRILGYSRHIIRYHRIKFGLDAHKKREFTKEQKDEVVRLRLKHYTYIDISIITGIPRHYIVNICRKHIDKDKVEQIGKDIQKRNRQKVDYSQLPELHKQGLNDAEIGSILNTTRQNICNQRNLLGLPSNIKRFSKEDDNTIIEMLDNNNTVNEISEHLNREPVSIYKRLKRIGINIKEKQNEDDS